MAEKKEPKKGKNNPSLESKFDPMGSYTGVPEDEDEVPVQDADDL